MLGEIILVFSNTMYVPDNFSMINGDSRRTRMSRGLQEETEFPPLLDIGIANKGEDEEHKNMRNLEFFWNVTSFTKHKVIIQCTFEESFYISSN